MRSELRIRELARLGNIAAPRILQAGTHSVTKQQVQGRLRARIIRSLSNIKRAQRMILRQLVLQCFDHSRSRDRARHKRYANRHKRAWRERLRCQSGPETVAISGDSGETCNAVLLDEIVDLAALDIGVAMIACIRTGITSSGPGFGYSLRQVLRVGAHIQRSRGITPDLPGRLGVLQALEKPRFLRGAKNCLGRTIFGKIGYVSVTEMNRLWRMAAIVSTPSIHDLHSLFGDPLREVGARQSFRFRPSQGLFRAISTLVGHDQFDIAPPSQSSVPGEASNSGKIIRFLTETVLVETSDECIGYSWRIEAVKRRSARLGYPSRLVLKERLIGRHFAGLGGSRLSVKYLHSLPAQPTEFVVVPHVDERPARPRVLKIGIAEIGAINGAIVFHCRRNVEIINFLAMRIADEVPHPAVVHALRPILGIPDDFIDEV